MARPPPHCVRAAGRAGRLRPAPRASRSACARPARGRRGARRRRSARARAGRDQLVGESGLERACPQQRLGERDQRRVPGLRALARRLARDRRRLASGGDRVEDRRAAAPDTRRVDAADLLERRAGSTAGAWRARPAAGRRAPSRPGGPPELAVRSRQAAELARHGAGARVELVDARQSLPCGVGIALVGGRLEAPAFLDAPSSSRPLSLRRRWSSSASSSRWATSSAA